MLTIPYYAGLPFLALFHVLLFILTPFWTLAHFILLPIIYLTHTLVSIALLPFRLHLLDRLETIYIYLGIAGLIGCLAGALLHFSFSFLSSTLSIDAASESEAAASRGRRLAAYRAARRTSKVEQVHYASSPTMLKTASGERRQRGLLSQTITEEEEDSDV